MAKIFNATSIDDVVLGTDPKLNNIPPRPPTGGAIVQIAANSFDNELLISAPINQLFKKTYRKHTAFIRTEQSLDITGHIFFNNNLEVKIKQLGDFLAEIYLVLVIPPITCKVKIWTYQELAAYLQSVGISNSVYSYPINKARELITDDVIKELVGTIENGERVTQGLIPEYIQNLLNQKTFYEQVISILQNMETSDINNLTIFEFFYQLFNQLFINVNVPGIFEPSVFSQQLLNFLKAAYDDTPELSTFPNLPIINAETFTSNIQNKLIQNKLTQNTTFIDADTAPSVVINDGTTALSGVVSNDLNILHHSIITNTAIPGTSEQTEPTSTLQIRQSKIGDIANINDAFSGLSLNDIKSFCNMNLISSGFIKSIEQSSINLNTFIKINEYVSVQYQNINVVSFNEDYTSFTVETSNKLVLQNISTSAPNTAYNIPCGIYFLLENVEIDPTGISPSIISNSPYISAYAVINNNDILPNYSIYQKSITIPTGTYFMINSQLFVFKNGELIEFTPENNSYWYALNSNNNLTISDILQVFNNGSFESTTNNNYFFLNSPTCSGLNMITVNPLQYTIIYPNLVRAVNSQMATIQPNIYYYQFNNPDLQIFQYNGPSVLTSGNGLDPSQKDDLNPTTHNIVSGTITYTFNIYSYTTDIQLAQFSYKDVLIPVTINNNYLWWFVNNSELSNYLFYPDNNTLKIFNEYLRLNQFYLVQPNNYDYETQNIDSSIIQTSTYDILQVTDTNNINFTSVKTEYSIFYLCNSFLNQNLTTQILNNQGYWEKYIDNAVACYDGKVWRKAIDITDIYNVFNNFYSYVITNLCNTTNYASYCLAELAPDLRVEAFPAQLNRPLLIGQGETVNKTAPLIVQYNQDLNYVMDYFNSDYSDIIFDNSPTLINEYIQEDPQSLPKANAFGETCLYVDCVVSSFENELISMAYPISSLGFTYCLIDGIISTADYGTVTNMDNIPPNEIYLINQQCGIFINNQFFEMQPENLPAVFKIRNTMIWYRWSFLSKNWYRVQINGAITGESTGDGTGVVILNKFNPYISYVDRVNQVVQISDKTKTVKYYEMKLSDSYDSFIFNSEANPDINQFLDYLSLKYYTGTINNFQVQTVEVGDIFYDNNYWFNNENNVFFQVLDPIEINATLQDNIDNPDGDFSGIVQNTSCLSFIISSDIYFLVLNSDFPVYKRLVNNGQMTPINECEIITAAPLNVPIFTFKSFNNNGELQWRNMIYRPYNSSGHWGYSIKTIPNSNNFESFRTSDIDQLNVFFSQYFLRLISLDSYQKTLWFSPRFDYRTQEIPMNITGRTLRYEIEPFDTIQNRNKPYNWPDGMVNYYLSSDKSSSPKCINVQKVTADSVTVYSIDESVYQGVFYLQNLNGYVYLNGQNNTSMSAYTQIHTVNPILLIYDSQKSQSDLNLMMFLLSFSDIHNLTKSEVNYANYSQVAKPYYYLFGETETYRRFNRIMLLSPYNSFPGRGPNFFINDSSLVQSYYFNYNSNSYALYVLDTISLSFTAPTFSINDVVFGRSILNSQLSTVFIKTYDIKNGIFKERIPAVIHEIYLNGPNTNTGYPLSVIVTPYQNNAELSTAEEPIIFYTCDTGDTGDTGDSSGTTPIYRFYVPLLSPDASSFILSEVTNYLNGALCFEQNGDIYSCLGYFENLTIKPATELSNVLLNHAILSNVSIINNSSPVCLELTLSNKILVSNNFNNPTSWTLQINSNGNSNDGRSNGDNNGTSPLNTFYLINALNSIIGTSQNNVLISDTFSLTGFDLFNGVFCGFPGDIFKIYSNTSLDYQYAIIVQVNNEIYIVLSPTFYYPAQQVLNLMNNQINNSAFCFSNNQIYSLNTGVFSELNDNYPLLDTEFYSQSILLNKASNWALYPQQTENGINWSLFIPDNNYVIYSPSDAIYYQKLPLDFVPNTTSFYQNEEGIISLVNGIIGSLLIPNNSEYVFYFSANNNIKIKKQLSFVPFLMLVISNDWKNYFLCETKIFNNEIETVNNLNIVIPGTDAPDLQELGTIRQFNSFNMWNVSNSEITQESIDSFEAYYALFNQGITPRNYLIMTTIPNITYSNDNWTLKYSYLNTFGSNVFNTDNIPALSFDLSPSIQNNKTLTFNNFSFVPDSVGIFDFVYSYRSGTSNQALPSTYSITGTSNISDDQINILIYDQTIHILIKINSNETVPRNIQISSFNPFMSYSYFNLPNDMVLMNMNNLQTEQLITRSGIISRPIKSGNLYYSTYATPAITTNKYKINNDYIGFRLDNKEIYYLNPLLNNKLINVELSPVCNVFNFDSNGDLSTVDIYYETPTNPNISYYRVFYVYENNYAQLKIIQYLSNNAFNTTYTYLNSNTVLALYDGIDIYLFNYTVVSSVGTLTLIPNDQITNPWLIYACFNNSIANNPASDPPLVFTNYQLINVLDSSQNKIINASTATTTPNVTTILNLTLNTWSDYVYDPTNNWVTIQLLQINNEELIYAQNVQFIYQYQDPRYEIMEFQQNEIYLIPALDQILYFSSSSLKPVQIINFDDIEITPGSENQEFNLINLENNMIYYCSKSQDNWNIINAIVPQSAQYIGYIDLYPNSSGVYQNAILSFPDQTYSDFVINVELNQLIINNTVFNVSAGVNNKLTFTISDTAQFNNKQFLTILNTANGDISTIIGNRIFNYSPTTGDGIVYYPTTDNPLYLTFNQNKWENNLMIATKTDYFEQLKTYILKNVLTDSNIKIIFAYQFMSLANIDNFRYKESFLNFFNYCYQLFIGEPIDQSAHFYLQIMNNSNVNNQTTNYYDAKKLQQSIYENLTAQLPVLGTDAVIYYLIAPQRIRLQLSVNHVFNENDNSVSIQVASNLLMFILNNVDSSLPDITGLNLNQMLLNFISVVQYPYKENTNIKTEFFDNLKTAINLFNTNLTNDILDLKFSNIIQIFNDWKTQSPPKIFPEQNQLCVNDLFTTMTNAVFDLFVQIMSISPETVVNTLRTNYNSYIQETLSADVVIDDETTETSIYSSNVINGMSGLSPYHYVFFGWNISSNTIQYKGSNYQAINRIFNDIAIWLINNYSEGSASSYYLFVNTLNKILNIDIDTINFIKDNKDLQELIMLGALNYVLVSFNNRFNVFYQMICSAAYNYGNPLKTCCLYDVNSDLNYFDLSVCKNWQYENNTEMYQKELLVNLNTQGVNNPLTSLKLYELYSGVLGELWNDSLILSLKYLPKLNIYIQQLQDIRNATCYYNKFNPQISDITIVNLSYFQYMWQNKDYNDPVTVQDISVFLNLVNYAFDHIWNDLIINMNTALLPILENISYNNNYVCPFDILVQNGANDRTLELSENPYIPNDNNYWWYEINIINGILTNEKEQYNNTKFLFDIFNQLFSITPTDDESANTNNPYTTQELQKWANTVPVTPALKDFIINLYGIYYNQNQNQILTPKSLVSTYLSPITLYFNNLVYYSDFIRFLSYILIDSTVYAPVLTLIKPNSTIQTYEAILNYYSNLLNNVNNSLNLIGYPANILYFPEYADIPYYSTTEDYLRKYLSMTKFESLPVSWVNNIGEQIINYAEIRANGMLLDQITGEFISIMHQLTVSNNKRKSYLEMININNSQIGGKLYIPLTFQFTRFIHRYIPICCLQHTELTMNIKLNDYKPLLIYDSTFGYIPEFELKYETDEYKQIQQLTGHCYANYYDVSNEERIILSKFYYFYLFEKTIIPEIRTINVTEINKWNYLKFNIDGLIKEIVFLVYPIDFPDYLLNGNNDPWFDGFRILLNDVDREGDIFAAPYGHTNQEAPEITSMQTPAFYSLINQIRHVGNYANGVFSYSFAIYPDAYQPSGHLNISKIQNLQLAFKFPQTGQYIIKVYFRAIAYLRIIGGQCAYAYAC